MPWPQYERTFRVSSSQAEGAKRIYSILSKKFTTNSTGNVTGLQYTTIEWTRKKDQFKELGKLQTLKADLVLLAMGFISPDTTPFQRKGKIPIPLTTKHNIATIAQHPYQTTLNKVFVAGDARRGQSLVVWAISEGRECARAVDNFLLDHPSKLPAKNLSRTHAYHHDMTSSASVEETYEIF